MFGSSPPSKLRSPGGGMMLRCVLGESAKAQLCHCKLCVSWARCELHTRADRRSCSASCRAGSPCPVRAAVLLPGDANQYEVALPRVLPVMALAADDVGRRGLWPTELLSFLPGDDKCDAVYGQISAVDSYAHDCAHAFFGPTCEYSVAPVGRIVKFWNTPLLTVGALTHDFSNKKTGCDDEYHMLTRLGSLSFRDVALFLVSVMERYSWRRAMLVYDKDGYRHLSGEHTCKLMMEALVKLLKQRKLQYGAFDTEKAANQGLKEHLRREVGNDFSACNSDSFDSGLQSFGYGTVTSRLLYIYTVQKISRRSGAEI